MLCVPMASAAYRDVRDSREIWEGGDLFISELFTLKKLWRSTEKQTD